MGNATNTYEDKCVVKWESRVYVRESVCGKLKLIRTQGDEARGE